MAIKVQVKGHVLRRCVERRISFAEVCEILLVGDTEPDKNNPAVTNKVFGELRIAVNRNGVVCTVIPRSRKIWLKDGQVFIRPSGFVVPDAEMAGTAALLRKALADSKGLDARAFDQKVFPFWL